MRKNLLLFGICLLSILGCMSSNQARVETRYDVILRNGLIYDGNGNRT